MVLRIGGAPVGANHSSSSADGLDPPPADASSSRALAIAARVRRCALSPPPITKFSAALNASSTRKSLSSPGILTWPFSLIMHSRAVFGSPNRISTRRRIAYFLSSNRFIDASGSFHRCSGLSGLPDHFGDRLADARRREENGLDGQHLQQSKLADRLQPRRGDTAALRTIRVATELAWGDAGLQIGGDAQRGAREDALVGRLRRASVPVEDHVRQVQLRESRAQPREF